MKEAVIIGAGQTGRGFIAPILQNNDYHITFVDKNEKLIAQLKEETSYTIQYFADKKEPILVSGYDAYTNTDAATIDALANADLITTSVFAGNIKDLAPLLIDAAAKCTKDRLRVVCCENGIHVKQPLLDANVPASIAEGVIFCTTLQKDPKSLMLVREDVEDLPIDGSVDGIDMQIKGMPLEADFASLIQRKIYTYNFMSAAVSYLGDYLHYDVYGEAANNPHIMKVMDCVAPVISDCIAKEYNVGNDVQMAFTMRAINKFRNKEIYDTIYRNARHAERKLQKQERMYEPIRFTQAYGQPYGFILLTAAAAMRYAVVRENADVAKLLHLYEDLGVADKLKKAYELFEQEQPIEDIIAYCADF